MGDSYSAVAVRNVGADQAAALAQRVVEFLASEGIIQSTFDPDATLGGDGGYRPGPRIPEVYQLQPDELAFDDLVTNGMEMCVGRWANMVGMVDFHTITCPACGMVFSDSSDIDSLIEPLIDAVGEFLEGQDDPLVACPNCKVASPAHRWQTNPHLGFVNLAFLFWNWPPLDRSSWRVDIPAMIKQATGHEVILTYGRV